MLSTCALRPTRLSLWSSLVDCDDVDDVDDSGVIARDEFGAFDSLRTVVARERLLDGRMFEIAPDLEDPAVLCEDVGFRMATDSVEIARFAVLRFLLRVALSPESNIGALWPTASPKGAGEP